MRLFRSLLLALLALASVSARLGDKVDLQADEGAEDEEEEIHSSSRYLKAPDAFRIHDEYVVKAKTPQACRMLLEENEGAEIIHEYKHVFVGCAVRGISKQAMQRFVTAHADAVASAEESQIETASAVVWGLDRIDQRDNTLDQRYNPANNLDGQGVDIYVIDTGVRRSHQDFGGRAVPGFDATNPNGDGNDGHGHGTHVASTAAGTTYGVAKGATIVPVRVLGPDGSGSLADVIKGMDWVLDQHKNKGTGARSVANMSLGGGKSAAQNDAVIKMVNKGVIVVVAAGNSDKDACSFSPASEPAAITVGSVTNADIRSSFSNYGSCVDIFAPGSAIKAASVYSDASTATYSGTSMASPHVAGAVALLLQAKPNLTPAAAANEILKMATKGVVDEAGAGSPNELLYIGEVEEAAEPEPEPNPTPGSGQINVYLKYDQYSEETSFVLKKKKNNGKWTNFEVVGNPGKKVSQQTVPLTLPDGDYKFVISDAYKDGMCCNYGQGSYTLTDVGNNYVFATGGKFGGSQSKTFTVSGGYVVGGPSAPNPSPTTVAFTMEVEYDGNYAETGFALLKHKKKKKYKQIHFEPPPVTAPTGPKKVNMTLKEGVYKFQIADVAKNGGGKYTLHANGSQFAAGSVTGVGNTILFQVAGGSVTLLS